MLIGCPFSITPKKGTQHSVGYIFIYKYYYKLFDTIGKNRLF